MLGSLLWFQEQNLPGFLVPLSGELANEEKPVDSRKLAGLILKNALDAKDENRKRELVQRWLSLETAAKAQVKACLLQTLSSLIRDIYTFLDHCGYINVGIASLKDNVESSAKHNYTLVGEKGYEESYTASVADSEDGVSFIVGQTKKPDASVETRCGRIVGNADLGTEVTKDKMNVNMVTMDISNMTQHEERKSDDCREKHGHGDVSEQSNESTCVKSVLGDQMGDILNSDSEVRKRVIVIGAGPAGLTAARHLQRLGFPVTVLEARSRIGGRVFTDRSSLSVPVDLGASIITGVEADVATERRPDPSALVCAQLGLELTVLNSDCPLYDIVTRQKVPLTLALGMQLYHKHSEIQWRTTRI